MEFTDEDRKHLLAAEGYLDLGMYIDACNELDKIAEEKRAHPDILSMRLELLMALKKWDVAAEVGRHLMLMKPDEAFIPVQLAYATRRSQCIEAAREILLEAEKRFPKEGTIKFNLGCYAAQLNQLDEAKRCVEEAIKIDKQFRAMAKDDPDLEPIWSMLKLF